MPERASVFQTVQVGAEVVPGTGVAATKKLLSIGIEPAIKIETQQFRPLGTKVDTVSIANKEWGEAKVSGVFNFNEITYLFASILTTPVPVIAGGESTWTFTPSATGADTPTTYTVEQGDATQAHKMTYGILNKLSLDFSRDEIAIEGTMLGQKITPGIVLTPNPTSAVEAIGSAANVDIYYDAASGNLGNTKLTRVLGFSWGISDRFAPLWAINSANASWVTHVETAPKIEIKMTVEADAAGIGILTDLRNSTTKFLRCEVTGATIAVNPYSFLLDTAVKWTDVSEFKDEDGVYALEFTGVAVYDATWTKFTEATLVNALAAL